MNYTAERTFGGAWYTFEEQNSAGERLQVELSECRPDNRCKNSLPNLWKKHGYTARVLESYFCVRTYATDPEGVCRGRYNPQEETQNSSPQRSINFAWMLEATEENREKLLLEIYRRFMSA